ncbi:MAG: DUF5107 domain-containing protein [Sedimentisphaerales bacterium]|nr:DUF5107 domain-containing protein [Sedimentisphaerales bacterium]
MKNGYYRPAITILLAFYVFPLAAQSKSTVRTWQDSLVIPSYGVAEPDLNPRFYTGRGYQGAQGRVYPYPMSDVLSNEKTDTKYQAVYLENEYIKLCVLPQIGGRIFSAQDKTNGYDFFYRQHVIKPALIGMLGAWMSGGVEWNFPHHHRARAFMPMNWTIMENPDGSRTLWLSELERRHRMRFVLGMTLYPDRSYVEVTIKIFNRTPTVHSFLYWANPAVHVDENYQVLFPPDTEYVVQHAKNEFSEWPISYSQYGGFRYDAVNISWWKNLPKPVSFFCWDSEADYFGGYDHGKDAGVAYIGNHYIAPGKKFFTFGCGDQGQMWDKMLTDTDGPYLELMAGAYSDNQPDYSWIQPYEVKTVRQYWYPIRNLGGLDYANLEAALHLDIKDNAVLIALNATSEQNEAFLIVKKDHECVLEKHINVSPARPFQTKIPVSEKADGKAFKVVLQNKEGKALLEYTPISPPRKERPKPAVPPRDPKEVKTNEELYLAGLRLNQFYNAKLEPYAYYEEIVQSDPDDVRANMQLGILYYKRMMYTKAEMYLNRAIERLTYNYTRPKDGESFYYLGLALRELGREKEAYDAFYKAVWSYAWQAAGYYQLAELDCRKMDFSTALEHIEQSIAVNTWNAKALNLRAVILRKLDRTEKAMRQLDAVSRIDPLDVWRLNETVLSGSSDRFDSVSAHAFRSIQAIIGDDVQSYLELACDYMGGGFWNEAIDVLHRMDRFCKAGGTSYPILYYYLGYLYEKRGDSHIAKNYYKNAASMSSDYCFPFRSESLFVLQSAIEHNPNDAMAHYVLGNLLYDHQPNKAIVCWETSRQLNDAFWLVHRNLAFGYSHETNDVKKAADSMERAVFLKPNNPRLYYELDVLYEQAGADTDKRLNILEKHESIVQRRDDALSRLVQLYVITGRYDDAIHVLTTHHFNTWEGGGRIHDIYVDAFLLRGIKEIDSGQPREALEDFTQALKYPDNLEVGRPMYDSQLARTHYCLGMAYEKLGEKDKAIEYFRQSVNTDTSRLEFAYYQGIAYVKLGKMEEAGKIFTELVKTGQKRLSEGSERDFFEKFGEKQSFQANQAEACYQMALGYLGLENRTEALKQFEQACTYNPNHIWARHMLDTIKEIRMKKDRS